MRRGAMRHWMRLQKQSSQRDEAGQPIQTWNDVTSFWADIRHLSGLEAVKAEQETSIVRASVRTGPRRDIESGMRLLYGAHVYNIVATLPAIDHLDIVCETGGNSG